jgi:RimJ/RimL family protein N-acetyltransferase
VDVQPLYRLTVRTPRLELRLPSHDELVQLREVARAGIHPPEFMPFAVPWTDEPYSEGWVVDYMEARLAAWRPDDWALALGVWHDGELMGIQDLTAKEFAAKRRVVTGSWLGARFQRRGFGTEMRAAVLELAFRGLGAEVAVSGAVDGNHASRRVSEKLGYRVVGRSEVAPRGSPVGHTDLELRSDEWQSPVPVEIEGLEIAFPLFGKSTS